MGAADHDRWLEQPYADQDERDAEFEARIKERAEVIFADLAKGSRDGDCEHIYDEPHDLFARLTVAALATDKSDAEIMADVRDVLRDECKRVATWLVERGQ